MAKTAWTPDDLWVWHDSTHITFHRHIFRPTKQNSVHFVIVKILTCKRGKILKLRILLGLPVWTRRLGLLSCREQTRKEREKGSRWASWSSHASTTCQLHVFHCSPHIICCCLKRKIASIGAQVKCICQLKMQSMHCCAAHFQIETMFHCLWFETIWPMGWENFVCQFLCTDWSKISFLKHQWCMCKWAKNCLSWQRAQICQAIFLHKCSSQSVMTIWQQNCKTECSALQQVWPLMFSFSHVLFHPHCDFCKWFQKWMSSWVTEPVWKVKFAKNVTILTNITENFKNGFLMVWNPQQNEWGVCEFWFDTFALGCCGAKSILSSHVWWGLLIQLITAQILLGTPTHRADDYGSQFSSPAQSSYRLLCFGVRWCR